MAKMKHTEFYDVIKKHHVDVVAEYKFCSTEKWRCDFYIGSKNTIVFILPEELTTIQIKNYTKKINRASIIGYNILVYTKDQLELAEADSLMLKD